METKSTISKLFLSASLAAVLGFSAQVNAASACKGLESSACNSSASCSWVEGYQRKDGRAVKSFCRTKASGKKATTLSNNAKPNKAVAQASSKK